MQNAEVQYSLYVAKASFCFAAEYERQGENGVLCLCAEQAEVALEEDDVCGQGKDHIVAQIVLTVVRTHTYKQ